MVPEDDEETSLDAQSATARALRSLCIVIADDDRDAVLSLTMLLREEGHEVHAAYDAQQTLDQVLRLDPDALVLDIALGRGSGFAVAHTIRARHGDARPMIIGVSGVYRKNPDRILADISGFNHYLVKPFDPDALIAFLAPLRLPKRRAEDVQEQHTYRAAVARAAGLVGGARKLSERIRVPMADLTRWLAGEGRPTPEVFLRVVDILLEEPKRSAHDELPSDIIAFPKPPEPPETKI